MEIHSRARTRGDNDWQIPGENRRAVASDFPRGDPVAGVERRLAAAGLVIGKFYGHPEVLKHFDGGPRDIVVKGIAEASAHEEHTFIGRSLELTGHGELVGCQCRWQHLGGSYRLSRKGQWRIWPTVGIWTELFAR